MRAIILTFLVVVGSFVRAQPINYQIEHTACGSATGRIYVYLSGLTAPVDITWSNGQTSVDADTLYTSVEGLLAGTYSLEVTDGLGDTYDWEFIILDAPSLDVPFGTDTAYSCDGYCGSLFYYQPDLAGQGPYTVYIAPSGTASWTTEGISVGPLCGDALHTLTIVDANGCMDSWEVESLNSASPQLISQTVAGSCADGTTGSISLVYDQPVNVYAWSSAPVDPEITYGAPGEVSITDLAVADYFIHVNSNVSLCTDSLYIPVPALTADCGTVAGRVFADLDGDCVQDAQDPGIPFRVLTVEPDALPIMTSSTGDYTSVLLYGNYGIDLQDDGFAPLCPPMLPAAFSISTITPNITLDMATDPIQGPDAGVHLTSGGHILGDTAAYYITITNTGAFELTNVFVDLAIDALLSQLSSTLPWEASASGNVQWNIPVLAPFASLMIQLDVQVPADPAFLGTIVDASVTIAADADSDADNDTYAYYGAVIGPYDPNDKLAFTSSRSFADMYVLGTDQFNDYTIRFQNTGTAPATQVYVLDTVSALLDLSSFELTGASHTMSPSLLEGRTLRFTFPDINLPDSSADQLGSQGFVSFRIKPVPGIEAGMELRNAADIFFDLNPPIRTNMTVFEVGTFDSVQENEGSTAVLSPNPTVGVLHLNWEVATPRSIHLIDVNGRIVMDRKAPGPSVELDVTGLVPGLYLLRCIEEQGGSSVVRFAKQ